MNLPLSDTKETLILVRVVVWSANVRRHIRTVHFFANIQDAVVHFTRGLQILWHPPSNYSCPATSVPHRNNVKYSQLNDLFQGFPLLWALVKQGVFLFVCFLLSAAPSPISSFLKVMSTVISQFKIQMQSFHWNLESQCQKSIIGSMWLEIFMCLWTSREQGLKCW